MDETRQKFGPSPEPHEDIGLKEAVKYIYADIKSEPIWWPEEIIDSLEVDKIENGFLIKSPQARNHTLGITAHRSSTLQTETYFFEVTEPSEETLGLVERVTGMAHDQKKAKKIYESLNNK